MQNILKSNRVCAILRNVPSAILSDYALAVYESGIRMFEVALNSADAFVQITLLKQLLPKDALVGAGTAITPLLVQRALDAGAAFMLTPSSTAPVLAFCRDNAVPLLPGVMTPSDVDLCLQYGFNYLKLFPAADLARGYIKSLQGPFDDTHYVAVGGVDAGNIRSFFEQGFIGVGIGSSLVPKPFIDKGDWQGARAHIARMMQSIADV